MRPFRATTFVITFIFKMFSQQQFSLEFRHFLVLFALQLKWNIHYTVTASQTQWPEIMRQDIIRLHYRMKATQQTIIKTIANKTKLDNDG